MPNRQREAVEGLKKDLRSLRGSEGEFKMSVLDIILFIIGITIVIMTNGGDQKRVGCHPPIIDLEGMKEDWQNSSPILLMPFFPFLVVIWWLKKINGGSEYEYYEEEL